MALTATMAMTGEGRASLSIHDSIGKNAKGTGVAHEDVSRMLAAAGPLSEIHMSVNSGGGILAEGLGIYSALVSHPAKVYVTVAGLAASAASLIVMAGDEIEIASGAMMMVHNPSMTVRGGRKELEAGLAAYDRMKASAAAIYAARSGQSIETIGEMMDRETWFSADEAVAAGFATAVSPNKVAMCADLDLSNLGDNVPAAALALVKADVNPDDQIKEPMPMTDPAPVMDAAAIKAAAVADYKATMTRFTTTFGAEAGMNYLGAEMTFEAALVKHLGVVNEQLTQARADVTAAKADTEAANAKLAAVQLPGEADPVPATPATMQTKGGPVSRFAGAAAPAAK